MRRFMTAILVVMLVAFGSTRVRAAGEHGISTDPLTHHGKRWRLGYLEGGAWPNYLVFLEGMLRAMMDLGWIVPCVLPKIDSYPGDTSKLWRWAAANVHSRYIEFVDDGYWSCEWDPQRRKRIRTLVLDRLDKKHDIDLMIAMGTWAGLDLANNRHHTPTLVTAVSDAVKAGIIKSASDSGYDHVHAWVHPNTYERRLKLFHDIYHFRRLGLAYEDSEAGRSYAGLERVAKIARILKFELVTCAMEPDPIGEEKAFQEVLACHKELARKVDAMLIAPYPLLNSRAFRATLEPFYERAIPSCSLGSLLDVQNGVLLGISESLGDAVGLFEVATMAKIFHGAKPRSLRQVFDIPFKLVINMAVAKKYHLIPPDWAMEFVDTYYFTIGGEGR